MPGDGHLDLLVGNDGVNNLYLNNGTADDPFGGVSTLNITAYSADTLALTVGDVDGDGDLDIVTGNGGSANRLYRNNGNDPPGWAASSDRRADMLAG